MLKWQNSTSGTKRLRLLLMNGWRNATPWSKNGNCSITQSQNSTHGLPKIVAQKVNKTSLWKRWSPRWENSRISSRRKRSWWKICNYYKLLQQILKIYHQSYLPIFDLLSTQEDMLAFIL